jgi:hypothetical protein
MPANIDAKKALALRATEPAVLERLKARARKGPARDLIVVPDEDDEPLFAFWVHGLKEEDYQRLQERYSPPKKDPESGMELPGQLNVAAYRTAVILEATEEEDRKALWQDPGLRQEYHVVTENQLVDAVLGGIGMKLAVIAKIDQLSRYGVVLPKVEKVEELLTNLSAPVAGSPSATVSGSATA